MAIAVAVQVGVQPLPFAMTTLWLANTGSLLLPVSQPAGAAPLQPARCRLRPARQRQRQPRSRRQWGLLGLRHQRRLTGGYALDPLPEPEDRVLVVASTCCVALGPAFVSGVVPAIPSAVAAVVLLGAVLARDRSPLRQVRIPWRMVLGVSALFLLVEVALNHGLGEVLTAAVRAGGGGGALWRVGGVGAVAANLVNNLPAYLALEAVTADAAPRLIALLVGVNVGPLVTVWASLATILWRQRCRAAGLTVGLRYLAGEGLLCAVVAATAALAALVWVA